MTRPSIVPIRRSPLRMPDSWWKRHGNSVIAWLALSGCVFGLAIVVWRR